MTAVPDFALVADDGSAFGHRDLEGGRYLLVWTVDASSTACTALLVGLASQHEAFADLTCRVVCVSGAPSEENRAVRVRHQLPFPIVSDPGGRLGTELGLDLPALRPSGHAAVLVSATGEVVSRYLRFDPGYLADDVLDDLESMDAERTE